MRPSKRFPLLPRKKNTNKKDYGHVFILAGSRGMVGASVLASNAALLSGAGLTTLGTTDSCQKVAARHLIEVMTKPLSENKKGSLSLEAYGEIIRFIKKCSIQATAIGPGLSTEKDTQKVIQKLVSTLALPCVLDADGLNAFNGKLSLLKNHAGPLVLTPHSGEFRRLFGVALPVRLGERIKLAKNLSAFYDVVLVLKEHKTLVLYKDKSFLNTTGNPAMAKGGSGDVLTGIIAAFLAQGLSGFEAASWGVYFHGKAGDFAVRETGELSLTARDLIRSLPKVFLLE